MWKLEEGEKFASRLKGYAKNKNHKAAVDQTYENLNAYFEALQDGTPPVLITGTRIHPEGKGVVAFVERGSGRKLRPQPSQAKCWLWTWTGHFGSGTFSRG